MKDEDMLLLNRWDKTGLLEGFDYEQKVVLVDVLEKQRQINENDPSMSNVARRISIPLIRRVFDGLLKSDIDVQLWQEYTEDRPTEQFYYKLNKGPYPDMYDGMLIDNLPLVKCGYMYGLDAECDLTDWFAKDIVEHIKSNTGNDLVALGKFYHTEKAFFSWTKIRRLNDQSMGSRWFVAP